MSYKEEQRQMRKKLRPKPPRKDGMYRIMREGTVYLVTEKGWRRCE